MFLFLFTDIVKLDNNFTMDSLSLIFFFGKVSVENRFTV